MNANKPKIVNVVAAGQLSNEQKLDLQEIAMKMEGSRLNAKTFAGLVIRKSKPKGTIILFKSGKMIIIGCSNICDCELLSQKFAKDIRKALSSPLKIKSFKVVNLVASLHLGYQINVGSLAEQAFAYKDDKYPGVLVRVKQIKSALVFQSGKVMLNGAKSEADLDIAHLKLNKLLAAHKRLPKSPDQPETNLNFDC